MAQIYCRLWRGVSVEMTCLNGGGQRWRRNVSKRNRESGYVIDPFWHTTFMPDTRDGRRTLA